MARQIKDINGNAIIIGSTVILNVDAWERYLDVPEAERTILQPDLPEDYNVFVVDHVFEDTREIGLRHDDKFVFIPASIKAIEVIID